MTPPNADNAWSLLLDSIGELRKANDEAHKEIKALLREQNGRVRKLELWRAYVIGAAAVCGALGGLATKIMVG